LNGRREHRPVPPYDRIVAYHLVHADELSYEDCRMSTMRRLGSRRTSRRRRSCRDRAPASGATRRTRAAGDMPITRRRRSSSWSPVR
jgi:hypothetical protein